MFRSVVRCLPLLVCSLMAVTLYAQQFSADMVNLKPDNRSKQAKIYVSNEKMRVEMPPEGNGSGGGVMLWDTARQTRYILMPERRMYMDYSPIMGSKLPPMVPLWHPSDADNACPEWHKLIEQMQHKDNWGTRRKVGTDTVNGRSAIHYEGTSTEGKTGNVWVDSKLHYITKFQGQDGGTMELRNIQEGAQPASLFEVPAGYQKFDMGSMRIPQR